jgi:xylulokinase
VTEIAGSGARLRRRWRPRQAILAIDLGTAALRVGLVAPNGRLVALARRPLAAPFDTATGRAEADPHAWWQTLLDLARSQLAAWGGEVVAIAAVGHGPTCVPTAADGDAVGPAITWRDRRADPEGPLGGELARATGRSGWALGILPAALWLERERPELARRVRWYLASWEWLGFRLSGVAAATVLPAIARPREAAPRPETVTEMEELPEMDQALAGVGLPPTKLPPVRRAGSLLGGLTPAAANLLGLPTGIPVIAGTFDAAAGILGVGACRPGQAVDTGGASGGLAIVVAAPPPGIVHLPAPVPGCRVVGGAMAAVGGALDWLAGSVLGRPRSRDGLLAEAAAVPAGAEGLIFLPYLAGERSPVHDPDARGVFFGLTLGHGRGHLVRAVLEGAAFALRHVAEPIVAAGVAVRELRVSGGPARSSLWNQIKADVTGWPVVVPEVPEAALMGAAILGALGVGLLDDPAGGEALVRVRQRLEPRPEYRPIYDEGYRRYRALYPALRPLWRTAGREDDLWQAT